MFIDMPVQHQHSVLCRHTFPVYNLAVSLPLSSDSLFVMYSLKDTGKEGQTKLPNFEKQQCPVLDLLGVQHLIH